MQIATQLLRITKDYYTIIILHSLTDYAKQYQNNAFWNTARLALLQYASCIEQNSTVQKSTGKYSTVQNWTEKYSIDKYRTVHDSRPTAQDSMMHNSQGQKYSSTNLFPGE